MTANGVLQIGLFLAVLLACVKPLGVYMAGVYSGRTPYLGASWDGQERWCTVSAGSAANTR